jgi:hypothetical protein
VSGEGGEKVVSRIDPCVVCDKRVKANSVLCIWCNKWVHKRCSGVKGALKKVECAFDCKRRVNGVIKREGVMGLNDGIERVERAMVRIMCRVKLRDKKGSNELISMVGLS